MLLTDNNVKAELSYAYLHAVASRARFSCEYAGRLSDGAGVDARIGWKEMLDPDSVICNDDFRVQLKATSQRVPLENERFSYFMHDVEKYDELRRRDGAYPTLLVVFFLPENAEEWLQLDHDALIARRCAYWTSLWGAPATTNRTGVTVYLPRQNILTPEGLRDVARRFSLRDDVTYGG